MILQNLRKSRNPDKIYLIFSSRPPLPFFLDDFVKEKLTINQSVDEEKFNHLQSLSLSYLLKSYAFNRLAASPHISQTLLPKLVRQGKIYQHKWQIQADTPKIINDLINYLQSNHWLDPSSFAASLLRRHQNKSRQYLGYLFSRYHLNPSLLSPPNSEKDKIKNLLDKKMRHLTKPLDFKTKKHLFGFLARKGFAYDDIKTVIDETVKVR